MSCLKVKCIYILFFPFFSRLPQKMNQRLQVGLLKLMLVFLLIWVLIKAGEIL